MSRLNESWDASVGGFREDNPFVPALMNLDDVRKCMEGVASKEAGEYFYSLWDKLTEEASDWEDKNPAKEESEELKEKPTSSVDEPKSRESFVSPEEEAEMKRTKMVSIPTFITMLRSDIVLFKFEKKDGSIRVAYGTRNPKIIAGIIGTSAATTGAKRPPREGFVTYFDMEKESFRCFSEERFLGIVDEHADFTPKPVSERRFINFSLFTNINESLNSYFEEDDE